MKITEYRQILKALIKAEDSKAYNNFVALDINIE